MNTQEGFQLGDVRGIAARRAPVAAVAAGAIFLASIVVAAILPNQYETYTTILVEPQTISNELVEVQIGATDLNERLHLMTMQILSRPRLSRIIDDLELYQQESQEVTREEIIAMMRERIYVAPVLPELEASLDMRSEIEINTFRLYFRHDRARTAAAVTNRLANDFIEEHIRERVEVSQSTSEFIEAELARLAVQIQDVESRIAQVKAENPGRLPEDMNANQRLYERGLENLRLAQRTLAEAGSDEAFYRQQATITPEFGRLDETDPARRRELLELQMAEYISRGFTEKHPDIQSLKLQMAELDSKIARDSSVGEGEKRPLSPTQQGAEAELRRANLRGAGAAAEIQRLESQLEEVQTRLAETPRVAERLAALQRDYEHLFGSFQDYSNKRLEAAVAANAERRQKGEKLRVLEAAVPPPAPTSPNRLLIVLLGAMLGLAAGGGLGLALEATDGSFHGLRDLQTAVRLPVLAQIPSIVLESDRVAQRRRRVLVSLATAAIVGVVLLGAAVGYYTVNGRGGGPGQGAEPAPAAEQQG